ncbi:MAG: hypothetical protein ACI9JN_001758 [Bacteroidia bacterium]|jgi:hypothetical protein
MMPNTFLISMLLMLAIFIASRRVLEKANGYLNQEQKAGLVDLFADLRKRYPAIIFGLLVAFFANLYFHIIPEAIALSVYFFILISFMGYMAYASYKILELNEYPKEYLKAFVISNSLRLLALLVLIVGLTMFK